MTDKIYVVGHKSPDTDSVTSAITYANLKNAMGMKEVVPAAAGDRAPTAAGSQMACAPRAPFLRSAKSFESPLVLGLAVHRS